MFLIILLSDILLGDFLCVSIDQNNIPGLREEKKNFSDSTGTLNLQKFVKFTGKCGKFFDFLWQNCHIFVAEFGISNGNFPRCQVVHGAWRASTSSLLLPPLMRHPYPDARTQTLATPSASKNCQAACWIALRDCFSFFL